MLGARRGSRAGGDVTSAAACHRGLQLGHLSEVRRQMADELDHDLAKGVVYESPRVRPGSQSAFVALLRGAIDAGDELTLADGLERGGHMRFTELRHRQGRPYEARVPHDAAYMLAEGEFGRYYARGVCLLAMGAGQTTVEVYRARAVSSPRPESERRIGERLDPQALLSDLRIHVGADSALGVPAGPNSGLSVRLCNPR
jgi:hypothetical protein